MLNKHIKETKKEFEKKFPSSDDWTLESLLAFIEKRERLLAKKLKVFNKDGMIT